MAAALDGTCPRVTPLVLARKSRAPGARGPHTVPPVLSDGLLIPASDIILAPAKQEITVASPVPPSPFFFDREGVCLEYVGAFC
jgi:hypothetical protein